MFSANSLAAIPAGSEGSAGSGTTPCAKLEFDARLRNVDPEEADLVEVGDVLVVDLRTTPRPSIVVVRALNDATLADTPLGALLDRLGDLLPCLDELNFVAEILSINGGDVRVRIRPEH